MNPTIWRHVANRPVAVMSLLKKKNQGDLGNNASNEFDTGASNNNFYPNQFNTDVNLNNETNRINLFENNPLWSGDGNISATTSLPSTMSMSNNNILMQQQQQQYQNQNQNLVLGTTTAMNIPFQNNALPLGIQSPVHLRRALIQKKLKEMQMEQNLRIQQENQQLHIKNSPQEFQQFPSVQLEDSNLNIDHEKQNYELYQVLQNQDYQQIEGLQDLSPHDSLTVTDMDHFLMHELEPSPSDEYCFFDQSALEREAILQFANHHPQQQQYQDTLNQYNSTFAIDEGIRASEALVHAQEAMVQCIVRDPGKYLSHLHKLSFHDLCIAAQNHHLSFEPLPDMSLFQLFRKVETHEQAERAIAVLADDRRIRLIRRILNPYSEVTSSSVFGALNRIGSDEFVVEVAEKAVPFGLTLSRSNIYHLMKQYSVQGKVSYVERLFRALEASGKSWNSNCIVIMMLAYFNQGLFEEADALRQELKLKGIKISERIEDRLDKLLSGKEKWRWEDKIYSRSEKPNVVQPPPGFSHVINKSSNGGTFYPYMNVSNMATFSQPTYYNNQQMRMFNTEAIAANVTTSGTGNGTFNKIEDFAPESAPNLRDALHEPRLHLNILRAAGFDELLQVLRESVQARGPVENVCISFLFRKVETRKEVEDAMEFLREEREARRVAGISEEYNETTCSRIFNALFRAGAPDLALEYAESAKESGLILSGKALHELLKSFAIRNEVDKVEEIWKLVKTHGKPSSRIVYSIFRTYFDNNMMSHARAFRDEVMQLGLNLSASATKNIEEVLSGAKKWVKDPHALTRDN